MAAKRALHRPGIHSDTAISRAWNTMRQLVRFTRGDLQAAAECTEALVRRYVKALIAAGYVVQDTPRVYGRAPGGYANLRLVRNTGPLAPRMTATGLVDFNLLDPYSLPPSTCVRRHAHALLKLLREMVDQVGTAGALTAEDALVMRGIDLIRRIDESRDG